MACPNGNRRGHSHHRCRGSRCGGRGIVCGIDMRQRCKKCRRRKIGWSQRRGMISDEKHFANRRAARKRWITKALRACAADHANLAKQADALEALAELMAPVLRALWGQPAIRGDK